MPGRGAALTLGCMLLVMLVLVPGPVASAPHRPPPMPHPPPMPVMPPMPGTGGITVTVDGSPVRFDVPPRMSGGWVFVPLRGVFEKLGAKVAFQKSTGLVSADRGATHVEIRVGDRMAHVNGSGVLMLQPAFAVRGRTLVPLRFLSEALGAHVDWNGGRQTVTINTHGEGMDEK